MVLACYHIHCCFCLSSSSFYVVIVVVRMHDGDEDDEDVVCFKLFVENSFDNYETDDDGGDK